MSIDNALYEIECAAGGLSSAVATSELLLEHLQAEADHKERDGVFAAQNLLSRIGEYITAFSMVVDYIRTIYSTIQENISVCCKANAKKGAAK